MYFQSPGDKGTKTALTPNPSSEKSQGECVQYHAKNNEQAGAGCRVETAFCKELRTGLTLPAEVRGKTPGDLSGVRAGLSVSANGPQRFEIRPGKDYSYMCAQRVLALPKLEVGVQLIVYLLSGEFSSGLQQGNPHLCVASCSPPGWGRCIALCSMGRNAGGLNGTELH